MNSKSVHDSGHGNQMWNKASHASDSHLRSSTLKEVTWDPWNKFGKKNKKDKVTLTIVYKMHEKISSLKLHSIYNCTLVTLL